MRGAERGGVSPGGAALGQSPPTPSWRDFGLTRFGTLHPPKHLGTFFHPFPSLVRRLLSALPISNPPPPLGNPSPP